MILRRALIVVVTLLLSLASVHAANPDERLSDPALESRARAISKELRCVVCQNQTIDDSDASIARDLRILVRERLTAGDTDDEVVSFVVARYGEFVLMRPRFGWHTALLWAAPILLLLGGVGYLLTRRRPAPQGSGLTRKEEERLSKLLDG